MSSNPCNYMVYRVETIKRQTRAARVVVWLCGLSLQAYRLHFSSVCNVQRCSSCSWSLWCYI